MTDWDTYQEAYRNASKNKKEIIDSEKIAELIDVIEKSNNIILPRQQLLLHLSDFILEITNKKTLTEILSIIIKNDDILLGIITDTEKLCSTVAEAKPGVNSPTDLSKEIVETGSIPEKATSQTKLTSEIEETEAALKAIPNIRTMSQDMAVSQGKGDVTYSSTQAAILQETRPVMPSNAPRWGSEEK